jgi:hypothetical protein
MATPSIDVTPAEARAVLEMAARTSLRAPSVFNTQPWIWQLSGDTLTLSSDPTRRLGATDVEYFDPAYRAELTRWTSRPAWSGDGVPPATAVQPDLRRVPVRNFLPDGSPGLLAGASHDEGAVFVIIFGTGDRPVDLLRGGEAMSALLLRATADGLSTAPISEAVEVAWPRQLLRGLLSGIGEPYLIVRLGYVDSPDVLPVTPRRAVGEVIRIDK